MIDGFLYACGYGYPAVVKFLLERGINPNLPNRDGQTGLHWAMYGPHLDVVRLLLKSGAQVNVREAASRATPLDWAVRAWGRTSDVHWRVHSYCQALAMLVRAGATVDPRLHNSDPHMMAAFRGELAP